MYGDAPKTIGIVAIAFALVSCDTGAFFEPSPDEPPVPTSLEIDSIPFVMEGDTVTLTATVHDQYGDVYNFAEVEWASSDETIAVIEPTGSTEGTLTASKPGTTTITSSYENLSASATVEVHRRPVDIVYVSGSGQEGSADTELADSLVVQAVDRRGDPVSDVTIEMVVVSGGGQTSPTSGQTDSRGYVPSAWTLGSSGEQVVEARASGSQTRVKNLKDSVVVFTATLAGESTEVTTSSVSDVESVEVTPDSAVVASDSTVDLDAIVKDSAGNTLTGESVSWASSDPGIAVVDTTGLVTALTAGQVTISATSDNVTGEAAVTVEDTASGTLTITSTDLTLYGVGDTLTLTVEARAADGSLISDPKVRWSSEDTSIATVDTMGTVISRALGMTVIAASAVCCTGDFADVSVVEERVTDATHPNEPTGFFAVRERGWSVLEHDGWVTSDPDFKLASVENETSAPASPPAYVRQTYPAGFAGGGEPVTFGTKYPTANAVYASYWIRYSDNWHGHDSNVNKQVYLSVSEEGLNLQYVATIIAHGHDDGPLTLQLRTQSVIEGARNFAPTTGANGAFTRGEWHHIEVLLIANTPTVQDGEAHWWMNGVKLGEVTDIGWMETEGGKGWTHFHWSPIWGGREDTVPADQYMDMDHVYVSTNQE